MNYHSKIIIYDDNCPLCAAYTKAFIHTGLIKKEDRKNFSSIAPELITLIDIKRAVNEIPLIDTNTNQVWYGMDALLEILGQKIPFIKLTGNLKPVKWLLYKSYKIISYNRRVIVATKQPAGSFDCTPDFNFRYRISFMVICLFFTIGILLPIQEYFLSNGLFINISAIQLQCAYLILVALNIMIAMKLGQKKGLEYLGQINMLVLVTILLTFPIIIINWFHPIHSATFHSFYMGILVIVTTNEYKRRLKFAGILPHYPLIVLINLLSIAVIALYLLV